MKKIGIVGGVGWLSTVDYYSELCRRSEQLQQALEMSIESLDLNKALAYLGTDGDEESWSQFDDYHRAALQRLQASGAAFAIIASNTPHHRFASIVRGVQIPVLSILDVTAKYCARLGATQVLLLGTGQTMRSPIFRDEFAKHGVTASGPHDPPARAMTMELIAELQRGELAGAAAKLTRIAKASLERPVVCLACTELPLAFPQHKTLTSFEYGGVMYINATAVHIEAAFHLAAAT